MYYTEKTHYAGYEGLAIGIIRQAVKDYRNKTGNMYDLNKFFNSAWFDTLCMGIDKDYILERMREE